MRIKCGPGVFEEDLECLKCSALNFRLIFGLFELAQLASKSSFLAPISLAGPLLIRTCKLQHFCKFDIRSDA